MIRSHIIFLFLIQSITWGGEKVFKYYQDSSPVVIIDDIYLNFKTLGLNLEPGDTLYVKLEHADRHKGVVEWGHRKGVTGRSWFRKLLSKTNRRRMVA